MHIPDGYLGPQTYGALYAVMTPFWIVAARKVRDTLRAKQIPLLALGAVFSFVIMMFNVPAPGGSTGHAVGGALLGIVLGPWAAMLAVSAALVVQAFLFGDGGITAIGANCFNMAVVMPFAGYAVYRLLAGGAAAAPRRRVAAAGIAGYVSLNLAAFFTAIEFGIQPAMAHLPDGTPMYCPYPLKVAIPVMMSEHLLIFGFVEAVVTGLVVGHLLKADPALMGLRMSGLKAGEPRRGIANRLWWGAAALVLLSPAGLIASGTAWGEWASEEIGKNLGFIPAGLNRLGGIWNSAMPDYSIPGLTGAAGAIVAYILSAVTGAGIAGLSIYALARILTKKEPEPDDGWGVE